MDVFELMVKGRSNKEIAGELAIARRAGAKLHVSSILNKLGIYDHTNAVTALQREIVHLGCKNTRHPERIF